MDNPEIEKAKISNFVSHWFQWNELYLSELSKRDLKGYGYRCGAFFPNGASNGRNHVNWPDFYKSLAVNGFPYISIHALFCYQNYLSCKIYIDSQGRNFTFP